MTYVYILDQRLEKKWLKWQHIVLTLRDCEVITKYVRKERTPTSQAQLTFSDTDSVPKDKNLIFVSANQQNYRKLFDNPSSSSFQNYQG
jgi:hypothetical protein